MPAPPLPDSAQSERPFCWRCGYDLGATLIAGRDTTCPECGALNERPGGPHGLVPFRPGPPPPRVIDLVGRSLIWDELSVMLGMGLGLFAGAAASGPSRYMIGSAAGGAIGVIVWSAAHSVEHGLRVQPGERLAAALRFGLITGAASAPGPLIIWVFLVTR